MMEKYLNPNHPNKGIITPLSECGKPVFLTNLISNNNNKYEKKYLFSVHLFIKFCIKKELSVLKIVYLITYSQIF